jgi:hypothetical protein
MAARRKKRKITRFYSWAKFLDLFYFFLTPTFYYSKKYYLIYKYYITSKKHGITPVEVLRYQREINPQNYIRLTF